MKKTGAKKKLMQPQIKVPPSKPYGFCCDAAKDESLARPDDDPMLSNVTLSAGGPNFKIRLEEFDPMPPKRVPTTTRSKSPKI